MMKAVARMAKWYLDFDDMKGKSKKFLNKQAKNGDFCKSIPPT
jgi:hypothetical protein